MTNRDTPERLAERIRAMGPTEIGRLADLLESRVAGDDLSRVPHVPGGREATPLHPAQLRLWMVDQLADNPTGYNLGAVLWIEGRLRRDALRGAVEDVVARHSVLRVRIAVVDGVPSQVPHPAGRVPLPVVDLRGTVPDGRSEARRLAERLLRTRFVLEDGPLHREVLLQLGPSDSALVFCVHHIVADGWSLELLVRELSECYRARVAGEKPKLPAVRVDFHDFALWERARRMSPEFSERVEYWRAQLQDLPSLALPQREGAAGPARQNVHLPQSAVDRLRAVADSERTTPFVVGLAVYAILLRWYTSQEDVAIGTPTLGRDLPELEGVVGLVANTVVLRIDMRGDPTVREVVRRARAVVLGAYEHQDVPFERIVQELNPARDLHQNPLFQTLFHLLYRDEAGAAQLGDLRVRMESLDAWSSEFALALALDQSKNGWEGSFKFDRRRFGREMAERIAADWGRVAHAVALEPDARVSRVCQNGDQARLLASSSGRAAPTFLEGTVVDDFLVAARRAPDSIALIDADGAAVSYRALAGAAGQLAASLTTSPGDRVGVLCSRSIEGVVALLGVWLRGSVYVPLNPSFPEARLREIVDDADLRTVLVADELLETGNRVAPDVQPLRRQYATGHLPPPSGTPGVAYVVYTSGSSGRPKGVVTGHREFANLIRSQLEFYEIGAADRTTHCLSIGFDGSICEIMLALSAGARLCIASDRVVNALSGLTQFLREEHVSVLKLPPSLLSGVAADKVPDVRVVGSVAESCPRELVQRWQRGRRFVNGYGPSEATVGVSLEECDSAEGDQAPAIGRPMPNMSVLVLNGDLVLVPRGCEGELFLGGESLAHGYLGNPRLTAERFLPEPFTGRPGTRMYRSGDVGRQREDGRFEFLGRADDQVKVRGNRVELSEVEAVLLRHEGVAACGVVADPTGQGLWGFLVERSEGATSESGLYRHLRAHLPSFMVPTRIEAVEALPRTPAGKLDRTKLLQWGGRSRAGSSVGPRSELEASIGRTFCETLGLDEVGVHDNFFLLGGHSLLGTQLVSRLEEELHVEVSLRVLFERPTVAEMAEYVSHAAPSPDAAGPPEDTYPSEEELLSRIDELSPEEVRAHLRRLAESQET